MAEVPDGSSATSSASEAVTPTAEGAAGGESDVTTSYANESGTEWEARPISMVGAVKSFMLQLRVGMDMTHLSMPAMFQLPYSILEFIAVRMSAMFHCLLEVPNLRDPQERLEGIVKWAIACTRKEDLFSNHKPLNPVLGEVHQARIDHPDGSFSYVLCEQVLHHPPTTAFVIYNPRHGVQLSGNVLFGVTLATNSVSVTISGGLKVRFDRVYDAPDAATPHAEEYVCPEGITDMCIQNTFLGEKRVYWTGPFSVTCNDSPWRACLSFSDAADGTANIIRGIIWDEDTHIRESRRAEEEAQAKAEKAAQQSWLGWAVSGVGKGVGAVTGIFSGGTHEDFPHVTKRSIVKEILGACGEMIHARTRAYDEADEADEAEGDPAKMKSNTPKKFQKKAKSKTLSRPSTLKGLNIGEEYPELFQDPTDLRTHSCHAYPPTSRLPPNSSIRVWREVGEAIVVDDQPLADERKSAIENSEREKRKARTEPHQQAHFKEGWLQEEGGAVYWEVADPEWYKKDEVMLGLYQQE
eukprot:TRINITY_DN701_c0_g1_i2.p1 TRINITY_DN701_c0_g1~~TRINITY_DN701_c0_g1_i2.p1  ORF type:complete len:524 (-),score=225.40 TRINITY_DN701_c0_g1_i2:447-2018(-)